MRNNKDENKKRHELNNSQFHKEQCRHHDCYKCKKEWFEECYSDYANKKNKS